MRVFFCQNCGERLFFENTFCVSCGSSLGFFPATGLLGALELQEDGSWSSEAAGGKGARSRKCRNYEFEQVCNWMVPAEDPDAFCESCRLNAIIPNLSTPRNRQLWGEMEAAKRRLLFTLYRLGLPVMAKSADPQRGLCFRFLADDGTSEGERVLTGHDEGVITLNLDEADDAAREKMRQNLREKYRTLLGHFRHEVGHYYWDRLVRGHPRIEEFRAVFGDEREDYGEALQRHYRQGPPADWQSRYVTPYAASHPWEDWAETWAHYLHIMDTLETAASMGVSIRSLEEQTPIESPYGRPFSSVLGAWHTLRFAINSINRSMGMPDPYPFVLSGPVSKKLEWIHDCVVQSATG